jgi:hypothetical protein
MPLILLIIGVVLIVYNYRAIKREEKDKHEAGGFDISFHSKLQDSKEELNDYKIEIGLLRKDMAESLTELQEEIFDIKKDIHRLENENSHRLENKNSQLLQDEKSQLLKHDNHNLLKNNKQDRLKNDSQLYENKEGLEDNYLNDENIRDVTINELEGKAEADEKENIDYEIENSTILNSEIKDGVVSEIDFSAKVDSNKTASIKKLLSEGFTEEQICHELAVSKGEVLLVKGLYKK